jgi:hypothetical protein
VYWAIEHIDECPHGTLMQFNPLHVAGAALLTNAGGARPGVKPSRFDVVSEYVHIKLARALHDPRR